MIMIHRRDAECAEKMIFSLAGERPAREKDLSPGLCVLCNSVVDN